ncbi:MAG TPA: MoaD/ThiS family protein [Candidimonas sp.]|nr:MoaD/ThiS family protein [Candidimonas sp.]
MSTIQITLNGNVHTVAQGLTLEALLRDLLPGSAEPATAIATAVNSQHVARHARASLVLGDQDTVTTFEPISGG